jgi:hypothetical protein
VRFFLGKALQLIGICNVGFGLIYGLANEGGLRFELHMLIIGSIVFFVGRLIEGRGAA